MKIKPKVFTQADIDAMRKVSWTTKTDDWIKKTSGGRRDKKIAAKLEKAYDKKEEEEDLNV